MKSYRKAIAGALIVVFVASMGAKKDEHVVESFVASPVARTKKAPSMNDLKEQCAGQMADTLKLLPLLMTQMADLQRQVVAQFEDLLEGGKTIAGEAMSKDSLHKIALRQELLNDKIKKLTQEMNQFLRDTSK